MRDMKFWKINFPRISWNEMTESFPKESDYRGIFEENHSIVFSRGSKEINEPNRALKDFCLLFNVLS